MIYIDIKYFHILRLNLNKWLKIIFSLILVTSVIISFLWSFKKKETHPNILVISIENFYLSDPVELDSFYVFLNDYSKKNNLHFNKQLENALPINWIAEIGKWPLELWSKKVISPIGLGSDLHNDNGAPLEGNYYTEIRENVDLMPFSNLIINRLFEQKINTPFFLLLNYQILNSPLYSPSFLTESLLPPELTKSLNSYLMDPGQHKNKSLIYAVLFDNLKTNLINSFQSQAINTKKTNIRDPLFWQNAINNFQEDSDKAQDINLISQLYNIKKIKRTSSVEIVLEELKLKNKLMNTEVFIVFNSPNRNRSNLAVFYEKTMRRKIFSFHLSPFKSASQIKLQKPESLILELRKKIERSQ
jgi:hypothetical protein